MVRTIPAKISIVKLGSLSPDIPIALAAVSATGSSYVTAPTTDSLIHEIGLPSAGISVNNAITIGILGKM